MGVAEAMVVGVDAQVLVLGVEGTKHNCRSVVSDQWCCLRLLKCLPWFKLWCSKSVYKSMKLWVTFIIKGLLSGESLLFSMMK